MSLSSECEFYLSSDTDSIELSGPLVKAIREVLADHQFINEDLGDGMVESHSNEPVQEVLAKLDKELTRWYKGEPV